MKNIIKLLPKQLSYISALVVLVLNIAPVSVLAQAFTTQDRNSIYNNSVWYKTDGRNGAGGNITTCTTNDIGSVTPGNGAPNGAQFPNLDPVKMANAIDTWVLKENASTTMKGLGSIIVASAKKSNVNPLIIPAIAKKESSMADPNDYNVKNGSNSFGRTAVAGQPSFQGAMTWYKWSSVKASVDSTAPENQNAQGGGDMATYLRARYASQLDSSDFVALFMLYAPPSQNNTTLYIAQVQQWMNELVALSGGSSSTAPATVPSDCTAGAVVGDAVKTAINYAWPDYHDPPYCTEKPSYVQAIQAATSAGMYTGGTCTIGGTWVGVDCGGFVTRVMIDSGADPGYNYGGKLSGGAGNTVTQQQYLDEQVKAGKYIRLSSVSGTGQLQPGDIAINSTHTYMFVGTQPGFNGNSASASISTTGLSWRAPMASNAYNFTEFTWYRLVK
jgi:hypothetical protein